MKTDFNEDGQLIHRIPLSYRRNARQDWSRSTNLYGQGGIKSVENCALDICTILFRDKGERYDHAKFEFTNLLFASKWSVDTLHLAITTENITAYLYNFYMFNKSVALHQFQTKSYPDSIESPIDRQSLGEN